jgi:predicted nucleotidyltransferase
MILWNKDNGSPVIFNDHPPLNGMTRAEFIDALRLRLRGRVDKAYVFGSFNTPRFRPESDIDLILVCDCAEPFYERAERFSDLYDLYTPMDILVYRPEELQALLEEKTGFWKSVAETMIDVGLPA